MVAAGAALVLLRAVHPPAISTALGFAFYAGQGRAVGVFVLALLLVATLVTLQRLAIWTFRRLARAAARRAGVGPGS